MSHYTYMVTNKINGKVYVGSHSWKGEGIDPDYYGSGTAITRAVKKYGKENFQVEVLYYYNTVEECRADEERILTEYNVRDCPHSYNLKNSAIGWTSEDMTDEIRQKISRAMKGEKTPVVAIDKNGNVKIFNAQAECARKLNLDYRNVSQCLKGKGKTCKGYFIKYLKRCSTDYRITKRKAKKTEKIKLTTKRKGKGKTPLVAIQKDTGRVRMFLSQLECARKLNLDYRRIQRCLKGKRKSTGGYTFKKINRDRRVFKVSQRSKADLNVLRGIAV